MFKKMNMGLMAVLSVALISGCAHKSTEKTVDTKVEQESVKTHAELQDQTDKLLANSPNLSAEQRQKLSELRDSVRKENREMYTESMKLRSVLLKDVFAKDYNKKEVAAVEKKIRKLENKRLDNLFDAVDKANKILGRQRSVENQAIMDEFMEFHGGHSY